MRVVYVSHNEIDNGLVRSQVLPYLRTMAERHDVHTRLITFERGGTFPDGEFPRGHWIAIHARRGSGLVAKVLDVVAGVVATARAVVGDRAQLIHARSYVPAAIACVVGLVTRRPYVFDMRGFLGDEYREVGYWTSRDLRYRALRLAERPLLRRAAGIVCPTSEAERRLRSEYAAETRGTPVVVLPSMVDLQRFRPLEQRAADPTLVYSGTLGSWYMLDEMLRVYAAARSRVPDLRFLIVSRSDPSLVAEAVRRTGIDAAGVSLRPAAFNVMPGILGIAHVGIALVRQVRSKLSASALKVAEYLACGLPVIVNVGLGDIGAQVQLARAGHVVPDYADAALRQAGDAVVALLEDEGARRRARSLAEAEYDLREGARRYVELYRLAVAGRMAP